MQTVVSYTTTMKKSIIPLLLGSALFLSTYAGQQTERLPQQQATYRIISKENGAYYCLAINGKEYRFNDMLDMGEPTLKVYEGEHPAIIVIGLTDIYESVHFVYCFKDGVLGRLGQVDVAQPDDVEVNGPKEVSLKVYPENGRMIVESYLGGSPAGKSAFPIPGSAVPRFQSSVRKDTLLIKNRNDAVILSGNK